MLANDIFFAEIGAMFGRFGQADRTIAETAMRAGYVDLHLPAVAYQDGRRFVCTETTNLPRHRIGKLDP